MVIKVTDQNEQPPIFHDTPYEANVVENKAYSVLNSVVLKVYAYILIFSYTFYFSLVLLFNQRYSLSIMPHGKK